MYVFSLSLDVSYASGCQYTVSGCMFVICEDVVCVFTVFAENVKFNARQQHLYALLHLKQRHGKV